MVQKRQAKATQSKASVVYKLLEQPSTPVKYTVYIQRQDNSLAIQVAIREAAQSVVDMPASLFRSWVTNRINILSFLSNTPLLAILEGIKRTVQVLKDI